MRGLPYYKEFLGKKIEERGEERGWMAQASKGKVPVRIERRAD